MNVLGRIMRNRVVAVLCYAGVLLALSFATLTAVADIHDRRAAIAKTRSVLEQFEGRKPSPAGAATPNGTAPTGSPFVEGQTLTVAGAAMLQRVAGAVQRTGGTLLSSQVALEGPQSKSGMVSVTLSVELAEPDLQKMLYDIESGMPFLFVDQLVVQPPRGSTDDGGRLRVLMSVSGQWQGAK